MNKMLRFSQFKDVRSREMYKIGKLSKLHRAHYSLHFTGVAPITQVHNKATFKRGNLT